ncbi:MAG: hypothetical protein CMK59_05580 [Proteobacteria bacterium]|nr:hypothetical protein [Pseudomonadota bacterium]
MFLSILLSLSAYADDCDANALAEKALEGAGESSAKAFNQLMKCKPARAEKIASRTIEALVPSKPAYRSLMLSIEAGHADDVAKWLAAQQSDDMAKALRALGDFCDHTAVERFFLNQAEVKGEEFWKKRWYKYMNKCPSTEVTDLFKSELEKGEDIPRNRYFAILSSYARSAGADAIPFIESQFETTENAETHMNLISAFADASGVGGEDGTDRKAAKASIASINKLAPNLGDKALDQARITLKALDDEPSADALAQYRYKGLAQEDGSFMWGVIAIEDVTCKKGKKRQNFHSAVVRDETKTTWGDAFEEQAKALADTQWDFLLEKNCKGEGEVIYIVPTRPFLNQEKYDAWLESNRSSKAKPAAKIRDIPHEEIKM